MRNNTKTVSGTLLMFCLSMTVLCLGNFPSTASALEELVVGVAFTDSDKLTTAFAPFTTYLSESLEMPVRLVVEQDYATFAERLVSGEISLGFFGPVLYVETKDAYPDNIHYIATCMQEKGGKARAFYYGYFLVNSNSPYQSLEDLKGKKWGFTNHHSSSGYQYPMAFFARNQIVPEMYFSEVTFMETHPNVTDALAAWQPEADNAIDAGATWDINLWEAEKLHGKVFKKIARVGPIPLLPIVVSQDVQQDATLRENIIQALKDVPQDVYATEGFPYVGWKFGSDKDFDITRKVVEVTKGRK